MSVCWLLEAEMFLDYRDDLVANIRSQGYTVKFVPEMKVSYSWDEEGCSYANSFPSNACVVFHGAIELATRIHREQRWTPGTYCSVDNFFCSNYYSGFQEFLLNSDRIMLPFGEMAAKRNFLFKAFGKKSSIFVRPDSPLKLFTGQLATRDTFDADLELMAFYDVPDEAVVLVSSPKQIVSEWRFVVVDQQVVTGSQYKKDGSVEKRPEYSQAAYELACRVAVHGFQPDRVWVLDVCQTNDGSMKLLEIGCFGFAELYACDKASIVREVSRVALDDWKRKHT